MPRFALLLAIVPAVLAVACGGGKPSYTSPTATPDLLAGRLEQADVEELLSLINWQPAACGSPRGGTDSCPDGVAVGTELPMVYAGFADTFLVTADTLRPALEQVLASEPLHATLVSVQSGADASNGRQIAPGPIEYVGLEGPARAVTPTVFWADAKTQTGIFFELNAGSDTPILEIGFLSEDWTAAQQAAELWHTAPPTDTPNVRADTCAAGSTDQFLEVARQAPFAVYCPTYLPEGFQLDTISFNRDKGGDAETGSIGASFVQTATGARISFDQGLLGNALFPEWMQYGPPPKLGAVPYGKDFPATLYDEYTVPERGDRSAIVWGSAPDNRQHLIFGTFGVVDAAALETIAEAMARLGPFGAYLP